MSDKEKINHTAIPRTEYPRPQFVREGWLNLNGVWEFAFDDEDCGQKLHWEKPEYHLDMQIVVPFAYQAKLSGIKDGRQHDIVWYRREFQIPESWQGKRIILHFGAVDYSSSVWVNGKKAVGHEGGQTPFEADITELLEDINVITVRARDDTKDVALPRGKQYWNMESKYIFYTGTTGIWQTVWLEPVSTTHLESVMFTPDIDNDLVHIRFRTAGFVRRKEVFITADISFTGSDVEQEYTQVPVTKDSYRISEPLEYRSIGLANFNHTGYERWWSPEHPNLYEVTFTVLEDGEQVDVVKSYFGMRKISVEDGVFCLNNKPYQQRLVLDQGYFPEGGLTAPSDEDLQKDICLAKQMGFNGARKHQKVEDPRWLYWCDRLGYLVWSEMANAYVYTKEYAERMMLEWPQIIKRDFSHPSIVAWVPLNESWGIPNVKVDKFQQNHARTMYYMTKSLDDTRPVISNDGWEHVISDLCTIHDYEPDREILMERYSDLSNILDFRPAGRNIFAGGMTYRGEAVMVTEFGGIAYREDEKGWGYSSANNAMDYQTRLEAVFTPIRSSRHISGFCYTQLTDVEQEMNGLLTYNRQEKLPIEAIRKIVEGI